MPADAPEPAGGALLVRPPGALTVQTDAMLHARERYAGYADTLGHAVARAELARAAGARAGLHTAAARDGDANLAATRSQLERATAIAERLHAGLHTAARIYAEAEDAASRVQRLGAGFAAAGIGLSLLPLILLFLLSPLFPASVLWSRVAPASPPARGRRVPSGPDADEGVGAWLRRHPEAVTSPEFVELVRLLVSSGDDLVLGNRGVPGPLAALLGDDGLGLTGVAFGAGSLLGAAGVYGALRETPVRVDRVGVAHGAGAAPRGNVARLDRIPDGANQIRIERYSVPGAAPRWTVYISPTVTFDATGPEPFDLRSNLHAVAGGDPGALRAVEAAMRDAGVGSADEVQFVGYSQGGIIAARAVESGEWNAVGIETYGSPIGNVDLPEGISGMSVRHTDDLVPALAGPERDHDLLRLERRAFVPGDELPHVDVPAHHKEAYRRTAELVDAAASRRVREQVAAMDAFGADYLERPGGSMSVFTYHAERLE